MGHSYGTSKSNRTKVLHRDAGSKNYSICATVPRCVQHPSSNWRTVTAPVPSRSIGTVEEYQDRFQALLPCAGHLDEAQRVQLFTGGLLPPLSLDVRVHNPQSLAAAMSLARQLELREQYTPAAAKAPSRGVLSSPPPRFALPAAPAEKPAPTTIPVGE
jgi:hypothetical protein